MSGLDVVNHHFAAVLFFSSVRSRVTQESITNNQLTNIAK